jgi:hypothetical protein
MHGEFRELPGPPSELEARRQAFHAVMRRLLAAPPHNPDSAETDRHEEDDEAADAA